MENNTLNIKIEVPGMGLLTQAIKELAGAMQSCKNVEITTEVQNGMPAQIPPATVPLTQLTQPTVTPQAQQATTPVQQPQIPVTPMQSTTPTQQAATPVQRPQIPTTAVPPTHTMDELAVAASQLVNMGKQSRLFEILHGFGVSSLMELPQEKYCAFAGCLKAEGVKF